MRKPCIFNNINAIVAGVTRQAKENLERDYDVFIRCDTTDECILDAVAFGEDEIETLTHTLGMDATEFAGSYVIVYVDEVWSQ